LVRMMPTLGRKPSESITADHLTKLVVGIVPQKPMAPKAKPDADFRLQWHAVSRYALRPFGSRTEVSGGPGPFRSGQYPAGRRQRSRSEERRVGKERGSRWWGVQGEEDASTADAPNTCT